MRKKALIIIISVVVAVVVAGGAIAGVVLVKNNQTGNDNTPIPESASFDFAVEQQFCYDGKQIEPIVGNLSDDDKSRVVYSYALKSDDDPSDEDFVGGLPIEVGTYYVKAEFGNEAKIATITVAPVPVNLQELSVVYNQPLTLAPDYFTSEFNPKNVEFEYLFTVNEQEVQGVLTLDADVLSPSVSTYSYTFTPNDKNFAEYKGNVDIRVFASVSYFKGDELYEYVETEFGSNFDDKNLTQRLGYDMPYWETDDHVRYTKDTQIVGDTKVYFHEDICKYGITYHLDGGETDNPDFYTIEDGVLLLKDPTKQGYKFLGWYETATFAPESLIFEIDSSSQREYEIYAKFEYIKTAATVSFAPLELIYNGEAQALVQATVDGGTIKYSLDGSVFVETIPTAINAGEYKVYFKVDPDDKHLPLEKTSIVVTVSKANYDMSGVSFENKVAIYDGEEKTIVVSGALPTGVSVSYENNARTNAGEQTATAIFTGDSVNYNAIDNMSATLTIAKADAQLVNPTAIENLVFNGSAQALVNAGEAMGGTLLYSLDDTAYSESIPQGTKARSYTVYFKVVGDDNHNGIDTTNFVVSIAKADAILNAPTAKELTFNGHTQALVNAGEVVGGTLLYSFDGDEYSESILQGTNAGEYSVYFKVVGDDNHKDIPVASISVTIAKAEAIVTAPTAVEGLAYNGNAQALANVGSANCGTIEYNLNGGAYSASIPQGTDAGTYTVGYRFELDGANYDLSGIQTSGSFEVEIAKAVASKTAPKANTLTYDGNVQSLVSAGYVSVGHIEYALNGGEYGATIPQSKNAGDYTVSYRFVLNDNYEAIEGGDIAVTIEKATLAGVTVHGYSGTYDESGHSAVNDKAATTVDGSAVVWQFSSDNEHWQNEILVQERSDSGTYYFKASAENHFDAMGSFDVVISEKSVPTIAITNLDDLNKVYDGDPIDEPIVSTNGTGAVTVTYSQDGINYVTTRPTNAGSYRVKVKIAETSSWAEASKEFSFAIAKATYDMSGVTFDDLTVTYDGTEKTLVVGGTLPTGVNVAYENNARTNAGSQSATAIFTGDGVNYNEIASKSATLTIEKGIVTLVAPTAKSLAYTGSAQALVNAGTVSVGSIEYNLNGGAYSAAVPQGTNAGAYTVGYRFIIDSTNYDAAGVPTNGSVEVTIAKADYDMSGVSFANETKQYSGSAQSIAIGGSLPSGVSVNYVGGGTAVGTYTITAKFMGDTQNHNAISDKSATLTIAKKALTVTGINVANKTYDGTTAATLVSAGSLSGVISGDDVTIDTSNITATFVSANAGDGVQVNLTGYALKGEDKANYTIASNQTAVANISKLNATITSAPTAKSLTYSASAQQLANAGSATGGTLVYSLDNSNFRASVPTATDAGNYTLYYKVNGDANHNGVAVQSFDVTIQKATLTLSTPPISVNYNASNRTWDAVRSSVLNGISYSGLLGSDTTTITVLGMHNGKYKYGTVSGSYITPDAATFGSNYSNVIGSTYAAYVSSSNANYQFAENANYVIVKYKTAMISSTYYTVEDAIGASGTITFAGDSSSATSYVATMFSSLPTSMTGYATSYTISGRTVIVPFKNTTDEYVKSDYKNLPASNVYSALIIPEGKTLNFTSSAKLAVGGDIGYKQPNTTVTCVHGVVINDGVINLASGCTVNSYGYIKGEGKLNLASGATALDVMHTYDWPGGNTATSIKDTVLPLNAWTLHNISCELILNHGSTLNAQFYAVASSANVFTSVCIVSSSSSNSPLFVSSGGYARKYTQKATSWADNNANAVAINSIVGSNQLAGQKDIIEINGTFVDSILKISVSGFSVSTSTSICCPLGYTDIHINTGANLTLSKTDYLFMPGTRLVVEEGATLTINSGVDLSFEKWANTNKVTETAYAFKKYCVDKVDAYMVVNGTFVCKGNIGGIIKTNSANATLNLSSATLTSSHKSLMNAVGASATSSSDCAYQIAGLPAQGYFDNTSTLYAFDKATYTSQNVSGTYCWSGTKGSSNPGDGTYSTTCSVGGSCLATGTLITLADGTQKAIENVTYGDKILVWNFFTGKYEAQEIAILVYHGDELYNVLNLVFSDGTKLRTIGDHGVFDYTLNKYVYPTEEDYLDFIGHQFVKYNNSTGTYDLVTLDNAYYQQEYTGAYSITSAVTSNALAEGLLSVAPPDDFYNWVEMSDKLRYDNEKFEQDVATYGLYTYDDFKDYVTYETFVAFNGAYLKIAVEKGYFTFDRILELIEMYHAWMPL